MHRSQSSLVVLLGALVLAVAGSVIRYLIVSPPKTLPDRIVRIGVDQAPPYHSWIDGKGPAGFTVDVLNEAAARRRIRLEWSRNPEGPRRALLAKAVELWPLVAAETASASGAIATEPWMSNQYAVVWTQHGAGYTEKEPDWHSRRIAMANLPLTVKRARMLFPDAVPDLTRDRTEAMQHMCLAGAKGAFLEVRLLEAMMLRRPEGCETTELRARVISSIQVQLSTMALPEYRPEAEALRQEIQLMFVDGRFAKLADKWFVFSNAEAHTLVNLQQARTRTTYAVTAALGLVPLLMLLVGLYQRARLARKAAETASRAKSEFLANVSHEVRTPMNGVIGMVDMLLETPLNSMQKECAVTIRESARLQLAILNDILDSARIESGQFGIEKIPYSPEDLVREITLFWRPSAAQKDIDLRMTIGSVPQSVTGDPTRVRQILSNLVSNALKFTERGSVSIDLRSEWKDNAAILIFAVSDTGIGISADALPTIFEKFTQADASTTRRFGGTGLGLSICKQLCTAMRGAISVQSEPGQGSTFTVAIPAEIIHDKEPLPDRNSLEGIRFCTELPVLLVEDNRVNQKIAEAMLRSVGLDVHIAGNGAQAVDCCQRTEYSLVLMDCQMPVMDGYEATARIRNSPNGLIPIVALTAGATSEERSLAVTAGMDAFLSKPVQKAELISTLSRWIPAARTAAVDSL